MSIRIPKSHWKRLEVHGITVARLREGSPRLAARLVMDWRSMPLERALEYVAVARGQAPASPSPKRPAERPNVERVTTSIDKLLRALMRDHGVALADAIRRGACEELADRGVDVPRGLWPSSQRPQ